MIGRFRSNATQLSQNISNTQLVGPSLQVQLTQSEIAALLYMQTRSHPPPLISLLPH